MVQHQPQLVKKEKAWWLDSEACHYDHRIWPPYWQGSQWIISDYATALL